IDLGNGDEGVTLGGNDYVVGGTVAGAANTIGFNSAGVNVAGPRNAILGHSIFGNNGVGISAGHIAPVLTGATGTTITGTLGSAANATFRLEFFATPNTGPASNFQGKTFLGFQNATTDGGGHASFTFNPDGGVPAGQFLTA